MFTFLSNICVCQYFQSISFVPFFVLFCWLSYLQIYRSIYFGLLFSFHKHSRYCISVGCVFNFSLNCFLFLSFSYPHLFLPSSRHDHTSILPLCLLQGNYKQRRLSVSVSSRTTILNQTQGFPSSVCMYVTLRVPPLDSETGRTGELWSKTNLLNWQN